MTRGIRLVFARRLPPLGQVATLALVNMQPGCQLAKPAATAVAPPSTLMVGSKCKYQNVLSFFFLSLSFFLLTTWWSFVCGRRTSSSRSSLSHIPLPHLVELLSQLVLPLRELLWTLFAFSRVFSKSIDFVFFFYFLSRKITRKSYANILFAFFTWYLTCYRFSWFSSFLFPPPHLYDVLFLCLFQTHEEFMALWPRVFLSFLFRVCGRGTVNGSDFNEFYWLNPYPNEVYIFSCAPAVICQVEG